MKYIDVLNKCKNVCKIDIDETDFDEILKMFIEDTLNDIYTEKRTIDTVYIPVINGIATVDEGLRIIATEPELQVGDRVVANQIFTKNTGTLKVFIAEEAPPIESNDQVLDIADNLANIIQYNVAYLWFNFKKKTDLSQYWKQHYEIEKSKRLSISELSETYEMGLPFSSFF